jgi:hypothetical protein
MRISKLTLHPISVYQSCSSMRRLRQSHWVRVVYFTSYANKQIAAAMIASWYTSLPPLLRPVVLSAKRALKI